MSAFYRLSDSRDAKKYWIMVVREENSKGSKERKLPVPRSVMDALAAYSKAVGMPRLPELGETRSLALSPRTSFSAATAGGRLIKDIESRRYFQAWQPIATRAEQLRQASPHS